MLRCPDLKISSAGGLPRCSMHHWASRPGSTVGADTRAVWQALVEVLSQMSDRTSVDRIAA